MTKLVLLLAAVGLALVAGPRRASAGVIDDVRRGDCIYFDSFRFVSHGEPRGARGFCVRKAPGSLEATINARALGLDRDLWVHLRPIAMPVGSGDRLLWTFYEPISPGIKVAEGHWADEVRGSIALDFTANASAPRRKCGEDVKQYSVEGHAAYATIDVHVHNAFSDWWEPSSRFDIVAQGGVAPSALANLALSTPRACAGAGPRVVTGIVTLGAPSSALGTAVTLDTDDRSTLLGTGAALGPDQSTAAVRVRVQGASIGTHTVTARAGDREVSTTLRVEDCSLAVTTFAPRQIESWRTCALCDAIHVNAGGVMAATLAGQGVIVDDQGLRPVEKVIGVDAAPRAINDLGQVLAVTGDGKSSFIIGPERPDGGGPEIVSHEGIEGLGLGDQGMMVGRTIDGRAVVSGPYGEVVLPIEASSARVVATNALGWVVGSYVGKDGVERAFVHDGRQLRTVPVQGKGARALAVNDAGQVVGTARDASGRWRAFSYTIEGGVVDLGASGDKSSEAIAVDAVGDVIVSAEDGQRRQSFLVLSSGKRVAAQELSSAQAEVGDLLGFTGAGSLIARGVFQGEGGLFELVPVIDKK